MSLYLQLHVIVLPVNERSALLVYNKHNQCKTNNSLKGVKKKLNRPEQL